MLILNQTPVKTSKNYGINNIKLDIEKPKRIEDFFGVTITGDIENYSISENVSKSPLKYGVDKEIKEKNIRSGNQDLKIEAKSKGTLKIEFDFNEENRNLIENIEIIGKRNNTIIFYYKSEDEKKCYHNGIIKVIAERNSETNILIINTINQNSDNLISIENNVEENAVVNYTIVDFGGKNSISNYYSNLQGENSKANINTIYLGKEDQTFDINYIAELYGEKTETNIEVQGALKDNARKNFKGTIDFKKGCKKAKGNENEYCMLLSDTAKSKALPMLLCTEEDVEGNHSSSAGKIEENTLFYIMSRGISKNEAMKLLVKAKFNKVLENIKDEEIKKLILTEIDAKLE